MGSILKERETATEEYPDHSRFKGYRSKEETFFAEEKEWREKDWKLEMGRLSESDGIFILIDAGSTNSWRTSCGWRKLPIPFSIPDLVPFPMHSRYIFLVRCKVFKKFVGFLRNQIIGMFCYYEFLAAAFAKQAFKNICTDTNETLAFNTRKSSSVRN